VSLGIKRLLAFEDSKVVIEQVNMEWDCIKDTLDAYCAEIRKLKGHFEGIEFQYVPRNNNVAADVLSKLGSRRALIPVGMFVQDLSKPSIKLLDPNNLEPSQHDQTSTPPRDMLMSEKEDRLAQALHRLHTRPTGPKRECRPRVYHTAKCQLRHDWYRPVQKSHLHRRLDEVHLTIRRSKAPS
jgi:hypothetical protein